MSTPHAARRRRHYSTRAHDRPVAGKRWEACSRSDDPAEHDRRPRAPLSRLQPTERPVDALDGRSGREAPLQRSSGLPGPCAGDLTCRYAGRPGWSGQALVEFALVFPILAFALLGMGEAGMLFAAQHGYQSEADVVAAWIAVDVTRDEGGDYDAMLDEERARTGCDGEPDVSWPDGDAEPGHRVRVSITCHYDPRITGNVWPDGLDVSVEAAAVVAGSAAAPEASASPAGSVAP